MEVSNIVNSHLDFVGQIQFVSHKYALAFFLASFYKSVFWIPCPGNLTEACVLRKFAAETTKVLLHLWTEFLTFIPLYSSLVQHQNLNAKSTQRLLCFHKLSF